MGKGATTTNVDEWVHIAVVKEGSAASYFRNAIFISNWDVGSASVDFSLGVLGGAGNYWFHGLIDEVRPYERALSPNEIGELYERPGSEDTLAPSVPANLRAAPHTPYHVQLNWETSTDNIRVVGYKIYRDGRHIDSASTTSYTDTNLSPGQTYHYQVSAIDSSGNASALSPSVEGRTKLVEISPHPRLYLTGDKSAFLQSKINAGVEPYKAYWETVRLRADQYAAEAPYPADDPRVVSPHGSREIGDRLPYFAIAYRLSGDAKYLNAAKAWMNAIANYPTWGGDQDLVASHILFGMSVAYDWLYDELSPNESEAYALKMAYQAEILYQLLTHQSIWWADNYHQNHNYMNTMAIMAAAVALYDVSDHADDHILAAYDNFTYVLQALPPDGAYTEGVGYWTYAIGALMRYFDLEKTILDIDRVQENAWFQNTGRYRLYASVPGYDQVIQVADVYDHRLDWYSPATLQWLAAKFSDPQCQWLASKIIAVRKYAPVDWRNLLYYDDTIPETPPSSFPTYGYFEDLGLFTSRSNWQDGDANFLTFKAGPPMGHQAHEVLKLSKGSGHSHADAGVFLLDAYGQYMIVDNGYQYGWLTADHNTVTFDGGIGQLGETLNPNGLDLQAIIKNGGTVDIIHTEFAGPVEYLVADLTKIYKPELQLTRFHRHIVFVDKSVLIVIDELESNAVHEIEWRLHINETATVGIDGRTAIAAFPSNGTGLMIEEVSAEAHARSVQNHHVSYTHPETGGTTTFSSKLFQILAHGSQARIETVIRPFRGEQPARVQVLGRADGNLSLQVGDLVISISTDRRQVRVSGAAFIYLPIMMQGAVP